MASFFSISLLFFFAFSATSRISASRKVELITREEKLKPILHLEDETSMIGLDPSKVTQLLRRPRTFLYKGFLSYEECEHLISQAHGKLEKYIVKGNSTANNKVKTGISLSRGQDETVSKIEERLAAWTFLPKENGEDMQILPYKVNGNDAYSDNYHEESKLVNDGLLVATVIMYLSNVNRGGETVFPNSEVKDTRAKDDRLLGCAATGYAVKPVKGDALLFFHLHPNATKDTSSLHVNCRVGEGEKWSATKRIFTKAFDVKKKAFDRKREGLEEEEASIMSDNNECTDEDNNCADWAAKGECQRNPVFMLGSTDYYGTCRKSCGVC